MGGIGSTTSHGGDAQSFLIGQKLLSNVFHVVEPKKPAILSNAGKDRIKTCFKNL